MLPVKRVEMGWSVFSPEHLDKDAEESTDSWHECPSMRPLVSKPRRKDGMPQSFKIFRLFVSSTFSDLKRERGTEPCIS